jgi:hypothetical protein
MGPEAILLSVLGGGREGTYRFVCPVCQGGVEKRADRKIVALLVSAGVDMSDGQAEQPELDYAPATLAEPPEQMPEPDAPAFTIDDVIRFHFLLEDDQYVRRMMTGT